MIKRWLRDWLGISELSHKLALVDKRTRKPRESKPIQPVDSTVSLDEIAAEEQITKGYGR